MQLKTKRTRSRRRSANRSAPISNSVGCKTVIKCGGVPYVRENRQVDIIADGTVLGAVHFKARQRSFPALYGHKIGEHRFIGETVDAKMSGDGSTWTILLRVLDECGDPAIIDDHKVEIWFRESDLTKLDIIDVVSFIPGHSINVNDTLRASHTRRLVDFRRYHRLRDIDLEGPQRPDIEDDELLIAQRRDVSESAWRVVNEYSELPYTVEDPEWTEKLQAANLIFGWLRQECPRHTVKESDGSVTVHPYVIR